MPMFNEKEVSTVSTMDYILDKVIVNVGDNRIVGMTNDIYTSEYKKIFDRAIASSINHGNTCDIGEFEWNNILSHRAVIYEYGCVFDKNSIQGIFGSSVKPDKAGNIPAFDYVIVIMDSDSLTTIFYNSSAKTYNARILQDSDIASEAYKAGTDFANNYDSAYISSELSGFDIFSQNVFIPGWQENSIEYSKVSPKGMYQDESMAEKNAEDFFDNPVAKWSADENGMLTYSDENTVVKYNKKSNVFEYSNYRADSFNEGGFAENYIAAVNTIAQDSFIKNEYCLSDYTLDGGRYIFKFNYKINDRAIVPGDAIKNKTSMDSFIEVTTEMGKIIKYRKYAYSYENSESSIADCGFVSAIDKVYKDGKIDNIDLCYIAGEGNIGLDWLINIKGESFIVSAERE